MGDRIRVTVAVLTRKVLLCVFVGLLNVTGDIESVARRLGNGEALVERDTSWDDANSDESAPHLVDSYSALTVTVRVASNSLKGVLKTSDKAKHDKSTTELTETLHSKDGTHHGTTPLGSGELGGDNGGERVITTDT